MLDTTDSASQTAERVSVTSSRVCAQQIELECQRAELRAMCDLEKKQATVKRELKRLLQKQKLDSGSHKPGLMLRRDCFYYLRRGLLLLAFHTKVNAGTMVSQTQPMLVGKYIKEP